MRRTILKAWAKVVAASFIWATGPSPARASPEQCITWVAFYGQTTDEQVLASYDIVILDPLFQGSIPAVGKSGSRVCAYLSLGEIRVADTFYDRLDRTALLEENPAWPGTRRVDVRQPLWQDLLLEHIIPSIVAKGFTGLMLDTLDTPPYLEQLDPKGNAGMREAAVNLVRAIRRRYPDMVVIMNRGYAILPDVIGTLDGIVAESLLTTPGQNRSVAYRWNEPAQVAPQLSLLTPARNRQPRLPILSLDYWDPDDSQTIENIYLQQRQLGHHPYVATPLLDRIIAEPSS